MAYTLVKDITTVNKTTMTNKVNKYIVIHYTANKTDTAKANANYFRSTNRGASAHYFVDANYVYMVVDPKDRAWHVGKNFGSNNLFGTVTNSNSIGIEMCGTNGAVSDATFENTVALTKELMKKYSIPASHVYRHYDVCSKVCPGWTGWGTTKGDSGNLWTKFKNRISGTTTTTTTESTTTSKTKVTIAASTVKKGSRGSNVKTLQSNLNAAIGAGLSLDGVAGNNTVAAIKKFQTKYGLTSDGIYGPASAAKMNTVLNG
jgi:N-acetylmuramoyl-L-alanine amidase CwlA